ncbi:ras family-domain-containing protein [Kickxella alabastrina]|uniref:ras family-domain-containing protein n=1 Tax=Kickxella alabastrina TaxID=61397 RepID=UPI00221E89EE|nr:ras family-domain-containing protein [Kickxella alabastrina]KAI7833835.1 ras family-domain-containing protein [Kickxella alabastrina]
MTRALEAKVAILGKQAVGKTSLVTRYVHQTFADRTPSTIGASFVTTKIELDGWECRLQLWDSAGQERFRAMTQMYYRGANAVILVYDITSEDSFRDVDTWVQGMVGDFLVVFVVEIRISYFFRSNVGLLFLLIFRR